jgi:ADP-heptose:LPS heptosyltransferase
MISDVKKILLIRFSSYGDVTQSLSIPSKLASLGQGSAVEIHWATKSDFVPLLQGHPHITKIWALQKNQGWRGLWSLVRGLRRENFTHIYDAHNNLRSHLICWLLQPPLAWNRIFLPPLLLRKSQKRWKRFLLFRLRINTYRQPFSGQRDLLEPLREWGLDESLPPPPQIVVSTSAEASVKKSLQEMGVTSGYYALAPSAAHALKRWPMGHWKNLVDLLPNETFVVLGGPTDHFLKELSDHAPHRVFNFAGKTDFAGTTALIANARALITNDTGVLHVAEQLGKKAVALMGPAPFGFPSRPSTQVMEIKLKCRPCSKHGQGPCVNEKFHRCLVDITPTQVMVALQEKNKEGSAS